VTWVVFTHRGKCALSAQVPATVTHIPQGVDASWLAREAEAVRGMTDKDLHGTISFVRERLHVLEREALQRASWWRRLLAYVRA